MEELAGAGHAVGHDDRRAARGQRSADHEPDERRRQHRDKDGHQHQGAFQAKPGAPAPTVHPWCGHQRGRDANERAKRRQLPGRGIRGAELLPNRTQQGTEDGHVQQGHRRAETEHEQTDPRAQGVPARRVHPVPSGAHGDSWFQTGEWYVPDGTGDGLRAVAHDSGSGPLSGVRRIPLRRSALSLRHRRCVAPEG